MVCELVCCRGHETRQSLPYGCGGCAAAVEDSEVGAVVGLVGVIGVGLDVAVKDPRGGVSACAADVVLERRIDDDLGLGRDAE